MATETTIAPKRRRINELLKELETLQPAIFDHEAQNGVRLRFGDGYDTGIEVPTLQSGITIYDKMGNVAIKFKVGEAKRLYVYLRMVMGKNGVKVP